MKRIAFALFCVAGVSTANAQSDTILSGDALRQAISGKTVYVQTGVGADLPIRYSANGVMSGSFSAQVASLAGESVNADKGQWWISGRKLCQRWQHWLEKQTYCYELSRSGRVVSWRRNDGVSGTARIGN